MLRLSRDSAFVRSVVGQTKVDQRRRTGDRCGSLFLVDDAVFKALPRDLHAGLKFTPVANDQQVGPRPVLGFGEQTRDQFGADSGGVAKQYCNTRCHAFHRMFNECGADR